MVFAVMAQTFSDRESMISKNSTVSTIVKAYPRLLDFEGQLVNLNSS